MQSSTVPAPVDRETEGRAWLTALRSTGAEREAAATRLHALLLRAARFELSRRRGSLEGVSRETIDDLATQSANDALTAILAKLDQYRFESRFTTWAYKFATSRSERAMSDPPRTPERLIDGLLGPAGAELTCEQCFEMLDVYVDHELAGDNADARIPGMREHLQGCPACAEEHASLRDLMTTIEGETR